MPPSARRFSRIRLRELRRAAGISIEQLARDLDKSPYTTLDYELGRVTPPTDVLPLIADRFGVTIDALFLEAASGT